MEVQKIFYERSKNIYKKVKIFFEDKKIFYGISKNILSYVI